MDVSRRHHRYFVEISFKGTRYHGWQLQENAHSVQAEVNRALSSLMKKSTDTSGCGRTDAGVHAKKFFFHFDSDENIVNTEDFAFHLNCLLPDDIAVKSIFSMAPDAHARFSAYRRTYRYAVCRTKDPFLNEFSYYYRDIRGIDEMNEAASILKEYKDFSSFSKSNTQVKTNECDLHEAVWTQENGLVIFTITANRFLRNMVRAIVGTLMEVGKGALNKKEFRAIIESKDRSRAGFSVPACGLTLTEVSYPEKIFL